MSETGNKSAKTIDDAYNEALARYAHREDITGIDIGYKYSKGEPTDILSVRLHVKEKRIKSALEAVDMFPDEIDSFPVDVIQAKYKPSGQTSSTPEAVLRMGPCPVMQPGISVAHKKGTAGTLGMFVKDERTGKPAILSNWHVLAGAGARPGDSILQPGPYDGGRAPRNTVAFLERMYLGRDGDAAIALLSNSRKFDPNINGLDIIIDRTEYPKVGDIVTKSGRTTGLTRGRVMAKGRYFMRYKGHHGRVGINGFIIRPMNPENPMNEEISRGGDSGSIWLKEGTTTALGLHFAGETDTRPAAEHALACFTSRVFSRLHIRPWTTSRSIESVESDHSQLWSQLGSAAATRVFDTMDAREIRRWANRLMRKFPQSPGSEQPFVELADMDMDMDIGPFGSAAIGFAAGAASKIIGKQLEAGQNIPPDAFPLVMASFLAGAVTGVRSVDGKL
jgi:hypothetical protein